jgi:hypothetical protein
MQNEPEIPIATYRERFAHLRRDFQLYHDQIVISGAVAGNKFETILPLNRLVPEFGVLWFRGKRFFYGIALFVVLATFAGMLFKAPAGSPARFIQIGAVVLAVCGLIWGVSYFRKRPMYRFMNEGAIFVLDLIAAGPDEKSARTFAESVAQAIRECKARETASAAGAPGQ